MSGPIPDCERMDDDVTHRVSVWICLKSIVNGKYVNSMALNFSNGANFDGRGRFGIGVVELLVCCALFEKRIGQIDEQ